MKALSLVLVAALSITACTKKSSSSGSPANAKVAAGEGVTGTNKAKVSEALLGTWTYGCEKMEGGGTGSYSNTITFNADGSIITQAARYTSNDCTGEGLDPITVHGKYTATLSDNLEGKTTFDFPEKGDQEGSNGTVEMKIEDNKLTLKDVSVITIKGGVETTVPQEQLEVHVLTRAED